MPAQYFIGAIFAPSTHPDELRHILEDAFGSIDLVSPLFPLENSHHYTQEMGEGLGRIFFVLKKPHPAWKLGRFKEDALMLEQEFFTKKGKRSVNLDIGYLDAEKVVLASHKTGGFRIPLTERVSVSLQLFFERETFHPLAWTMGDFRLAPILAFFNQLQSKICLNGKFP